MANSTFPIKITPRGSSNAEVLRAIDRGDIGYPIGFRKWYRQVVSIGDFVGAGATSQELDLHVLYPNNLFPSNVLRLPGTHFKMITPFSGGSVSACTGEVGDTGTPDGIMTASSIFTGVTGRVPSTPGATENTARTELAFIPTLTLRTTSDNVSALDAGSLVVLIPWTALVP